MAEEFITLMADLDPKSQKLMAGWYEELRKAGFEGVQTPGLPFHVSLATFPLEKEQEAIEVTKAAAAQFAAVPVSVSHMGLFPGGRVLFGAPDVSPRLSALQQACERYPGQFPWTPHVSILIDEPDTVCEALKVLICSFRPFSGRITRLHLCAFWPTREILTLDLHEETKP